MNKELVWKDLVGKVQVLMRLWDSEKAQLLEDKGAKLVGLAPYLCNAPDADRYAVANVVLFIIGSKDEVFNAKKADYVDFGSLTRRFYPLVNFPGGDEKKKKYIGKLLIITSLEDMKQDAAEDKKYNPYLFDARQMDKYKNTLVEEVKKEKQEEIDEIFTVKDALAGYWRSAE
jgi:hypothetical protein